MRLLILRMQFVLFAFLSTIVLPSSFAAAVPILTSSVHLGEAGRPEWSKFKKGNPEGTELTLRFEGMANERASTLLIRQEDVKQDWTVALNGRRLGNLFLMEDDLVHALPIPAGALRTGENVLTISTERPEDILIHRVQIADAGMDELFEKEGGVLNVRVTDSDSGGPLPCRVTIVDANGVLAALQAISTTSIASRPGVVYTGNGRARVRLLPGKYKVYATRGPEYSLGSAPVTIAAQDEERLQLTIHRELDTTGWVAADTHVHTLTMSGHGDATLAERLVTLAGEAVELPVVTEHNRHGDYHPELEASGLARYLTPVPGNEVTTSKGHFNIFPVTPGTTPPDWKTEDWTELMSRVRGTPGVEMVILNHPTDMHSRFTPFARTNLNLLTGKNRRGAEFSFDGMEVINSGAMRSDWMEPFRAWFALLNYGYKITGIGSSDSHDVSRFIVGQGRTYIRANDAKPGAIAIPEACKNLKAGRAVVSLGLFPRILVNGTAGPGDLVQARKPLVLEVRVDSASWIQPDRVELYANGEKVRSEAAMRGSTLRWELPPPKQDMWLVLIASGPGMTAPYWGLARPYQPSSPEWEPAVLGATNPVWIDADADGKFSAPREVARRLLASQPSVPEAIRKLADFDRATALQAAGLLRELDVDPSELRNALASAAPPVQKAFNDYLESL